MCDQTKLESITDTSETESEEWDLIQLKDVQVNGSTSESESVEVLEEEIFAPAPGAKNENCDLNKNDPKENPNQNRTASESLGHSSLKKKDVCDIPKLERANSVASEPKDAFVICVGIVILGVASLITPDYIFTKKPELTTFCNYEKDVELLIKELQMYRDSNENLRKQIRELYEVVNSFQKSSITPLVKEHVKDELPLQKSKQNSSENTENDHLMALMTVFKDFSYLSSTDLPFNNNNTFDNTSHINFTNMLKSNNFSSIFNDTNMKNNLHLMFKIPIHLKQLNMIVSQHKNVEPFITKWGNKLNKFTNTIENDLQKMKTKFVKHMLKNINEVLNSFYKRFCNFQLDKIINVEECITFNFTTPGRKNKTFEGKPMNQRKILNNDEKEHSKPNINILHSNEVENNTNQQQANDEEFLHVNIHKKLKRANAFVEGKSTKIKKEKKKEKLKLKKKKTKRDIRESHIDDSKILNSDSINLNSNSFDKDYLMGCDVTQNNSDSDSNWYLNIGDHRSEIRKIQTKGDWLFERASARRGKPFKNKLHI